MKILCFVLDGGGVSSAVEGSRNGVPSTVHSGTRLQQNTAIVLLTKQTARSINITSAFGKFRESIENFLKSVFSVQKWISKKSKKIVFPTTKSSVFRRASFGRTPKNTTFRFFWKFPEFTEHHFQQKKLKTSIFRDYRTH